MTTLTDLPLKLDIQVYQGDGFEHSFWFAGDDDEPLDLTGYSGSMHVRRRASSTDIALEITTSNGRMIIPTQSGAWTGAWSTGTTYSTDDVVLHNNIYWIALSGNSSSEPKVGNSDWGKSPLGRVDVDVSGEDLGGLGSGLYQYDWQFTPPSGAANRKTWLAGTFMVSSEKTR